LLEGKDSDGEDFGMAKLIEVRAEVGCSRPDRLLRAVFVRVKGYATANRQHDMTAVVLKAFQ
jgi:serine phosphatase RsbU (regulator of sigma subunit)